MRGKPGAAKRPLPLSRITPACAGKTQSQGIAPATCQDHPRVCGENGAVPRAPRETRGSPPRVRGKPLLTGPISMECRITPACAGKTRVSPSVPSEWQDHPRVCGENLLATTALAGVEGSPPRVRGKPATYNSNQIRMRITPACAGKTCVWRESGK